MGEGAYHHVSAAIRLNEERKEFYSQRSAGTSRGVSNLLLASEWLSLGPLGLLDAWAWRFNRIGIPIIANDYVSMDEVGARETPPDREGQAGKEDFESLKRRLGRFRRHAVTAVKRNDFYRTARAAYEMLAFIEAMEQRTDSYLAMAHHIVASIGLAAVNATDYERQSNGRTNRLARTNLRLQILSTLIAPLIDRKAQAAHRKGAGILINDLPPIPFKERWERKLKSSLPCHEPKRRRRGNSLEDVVL